MVAGKVIVITGASAGLGAVLVKKLDALGAIVIALARNEEKLQKVMKECARASYHVCDVSNVQQVQHTFEKITQEYSVHVLINNAGIRAEGPSGEHDNEQIEQLFAVNTFGTIFCTQAVLPAMHTKKDGQILNVVSIAGVDRCPDWSVYGATKAAITSFTDSLAHEQMPFGIKVMGIYPGGMDTDIFKTAGTLDGVADRMMKKESVADIIISMISQPRDVHMEKVIVRKFMG